MEKIKDFFYDKNDLVVALIIIVVAGLLIAWRVNVIMDYPQVLAAELEEQQQQQAEQDENLAGGDSDSDGEDKTTGGSIGDGNGAQAGNSGQPAGSNGTGSVGNAGTTQPNNGTGTAPNPPSTPKKPTGTVSITIPAGSSGDKIAQILVDAGVVASKSDFTSAVSAANADKKLKAGTFSVPAGSSASDIVSIITK